MQSDISRSRRVLIEPDRPDNGRALVTERRRQQARIARAVSNHVGATPRPLVELSAARSMAR